MFGPCNVQGGKQGGREHLRVVPPTSLPYSEGFDSPSRASPASSTSSTSLGARSAPVLAHFLVQPMLLQTFPQPCWTAFWPASLEDSSVPVLAPTLHLPEPEFSHHQHCVNLLGARWAWCSSRAQPSYLPHTATPEHVMLAERLDTAAVWTDSMVARNQLQCWPGCAWSKVVHADGQHEDCLPGAEAARRQPFLSSPCLPGPCPSKYSWLPSPYV